MKDAIFSWVFILAILGGGIYYFNKPNPPQAGRYQFLKMDDDYAFLLDTAEGKTWRWARVVDQKDTKFPQKMLARYWEPMDRFDNSYEAGRFAQSLQEYADKERADKANWKSRATPVEKDRQ